MPAIATAMTAACRNCFLIIEHLPFLGVEAMTMARSMTMGGGITEMPLADNFHA